MQQLYQVWDWQQFAVQSYHSDRQSAIDAATRLNCQQAMDWNGLPRYQAGEANDKAICAGGGESHGQSRP